MRTRNGTVSWSLAIGQNFRRPYCCRGKSRGREFRRNLRRNVTAPSCADCAANQARRPSRRIRKLPTTWRVRPGTPPGLRAPAKPVDRYWRADGRSSEGMYFLNPARRLSIGRPIGFRLAGIISLADLKGAPSVLGRAILECDRAAGVGYLRKFLNDAAHARH